MRRHYSNVSRPIALTADMTAVAGVAQVASTANYPEAPFLLAAERGTDNEEVMLCTVKNPNSFEVTRGFDGTQPKSHGAGKPIEHVTASIDFDEANEHVNNTPLHTPFLPGMVMQYAAGAAPAGWLMCQGQVVAISDYPNLYGIIAGTYNTGGEGAGNFRLPDFRGKMPVGRDASDATFDVLGETGGAKTVTLNAAQMPVHNHPQAAHAHGVNDPGHNHGVNDPGHDHGTNPHQHTVGGDGDPNSDRVVFTVGGSQSTGLTSGSGALGVTYTHIDQAYVDVIPSGVGIWLNGSGVGVSIQNGGTAIGNTGSGQAHDNLPPFAVTNFIIKT